MSPPDLYISGDVETDGPAPGQYSMLSFGFAVAAKFDGTTFEPLNPESRTFYRELRPVSDQYEEEALRVSGLDRGRLLREGTRPEVAMNEAYRWVASVSRGYRPVFVGYPAVFDWTWLYWYFIRYADEGSPFGFSGCLDIKTMIAVKGRTTVSHARRRDLPPSLQPARPHTHDALDDAIEQAELFVRVFDWPTTG